jgi:hypothetical protein
MGPIPRAAHLCRRGRIARPQKMMKILLLFSACLVMKPGTPFYFVRTRLQLWRLAHKNHLYEVKKNEDAK